jgi:DNA-binding MarR family transcriptional regulator
MSGSTRSLRKKQTRRRRKLVDRIERAALIVREPDPDDRRASRVVLTAAGKRKLTAAVNTEQRHLSDYVSRLLTSIDHVDGI